MVKNNWYFPREGTLKQTSVKPAQTIGIGSAASPGLSKTQQEQRDLLLSMPYLSSEGGVLKLINPASSSASTGSTAKPFSMPFIGSTKESKDAGSTFKAATDFAASPSAQAQSSDQSVNKLMNSPYLKVEGGVLKVVNPTTPLAPLLTKEAELSPYLSVFGSPTKTQPITEKKKPEVFGFVDPGLLAAQKAQEMIKMAPYMQLNGLMDNFRLSKVPPTKEAEFAPYGNKTFSDIQREIDANNNLMGSIYASSEFLTSAKAENDKLHEYGLGIATDADLNKLIEENNNQITELYQHYDSWDPSPENVRIYEEITKLNDQNDLYQSMAYEYTVRHKLAALPENLQQTMLQIPYLEDEKIDINSQYAFGSDQAVSNYPAIERINAQIEAAKKSMRDLGYTDKDVNSLIEYAERLYDKEQYEKRIKEKAAYAKEHPLGASIGSVFENLLGFMDPIDTLRQRVTNLVTGENVPINEYTTAKQITGEVNAARNTVGGMIEDSTDSKLLSGLYKGGMTVADLAAQAAIFGIANGRVFSFAEAAGTKGEALFKKLADLWKTELKNTGIDDVGKLVTGNAEATIDDAANLLADETMKKLDDINFVDETALSKGSSNESIIDQMIDEWNGKNTGSHVAENVDEGYNGNSPLDEFTEGAGNFEPDIIIGRSLGAKAKNYDIFTPDGEILNLAEGTHIRNVEIIAGQGRNRQIDMIDYLVDNYGGDSTKWKKCKGLGYVDVNGESLLAELHWYEEPSTGRVEFKIKPQPGGEFFIYEN